MNSSFYNRETTGLFTAISNRLSYNQLSLLPYIQQPFSKEAFEFQTQLKAANFSPEKRETLTTVIKANYQSMTVNEKVENNILSLSHPTTFTVTTGHQLSLFTGPIYFIYKILHTIRLAEELNSTYPNNHFVPVFWMASEDHDFEEIQSVSLFGKTVTWETDQKGPVGRFELDSFEAIRSEFSDFFSNHPESEVQQLLESYTGKTLAEATFRLVNKLFSSYGLIIVDGDNANLKQQFSETMKIELTTQFSFKAVSETSEKLQTEGIKLQVTPREINLFYIEKNLRSRIQLQNDGYFIEGKGTFTENEILTMLNENPSSFSPNVVLRPLYQETVLPNLCYLGGGGEIAYWLQLKGVFEAVGCTFPLIQVRNSLLTIDSTTSKKISNINLSIEDLFNSIEELKKKYVLTNSTHELDFTNLDQSFTAYCKAISNQLKQVNPTLKNMGEAEISKLEKQLISIKQKMIKTEKEKHEKALLQIEQLKNKLFPNGGLQERYINFFSLCSDGNVTNHLNEIYHAIQPFENDLIVLQLFD